MSRSVAHKTGDLKY